MAKQQTQKPMARKCGGCGRITPEIEYQAMKYLFPCVNPKCPEPDRAYSEKVYQPPEPYNA